MSPITLARRARDLEIDIQWHEQVLQGEIAALWPNHPWAGEYVRASDETGLAERILVAPKAGCLMTHTTAAGVREANWGTVEVSGNHVELTFETKHSTPSAFPTAFTFQGDGLDRKLRKGIDLNPFGRTSWDVKLPRGARSERRPLGSEPWASPGPHSEHLAFAGGADLRAAWTTYDAKCAAAYQQSVPMVRIVSIPFDLADKSGLLDMLPNSRLSAWVVTADRDRSLVLSLEDPRFRDVAGYATLDLLAGSSVCLVAAIQPCRDANALFREFELFRVEETALVPIIDERIFVGERGELKERMGWEEAGNGFFDIAGVRNPMGIWSWNGGGSEFAASLELSPGSCSLCPRTGWQDVSLTNWPHPLWVLFSWSDQE